MKSLLVLGSTGSIGTQTLDVCRAHPDRFHVTGLAAHSSWRAVLEQVREFRPDFVALADPEAAAALRAELPDGVTLLAGPDSIAEICTVADYQVAVHGIVGGAGLVASVAVLERGRDLALANKESLVMAGQHLTDLARSTGSQILPVDSELCAIFQCLRGEDMARVRRVHLTASGGPFRDLDAEAITAATPEMALRHPTWNMGPRITVGSATLMNKALEVLEVHHLFGVPPEKIHVVVHRQSVVHSMVEFVDGSVVAQLGPPDMRGPIHYVLHHPDRGAAELEGFSFELFRELNFEPPDRARFPALELGFRCLELGSDAGAVLNAADEVAVAAFLEGKIGFADIHRVNARALERRPGLDQDIPALLRADSLAREIAAEEVSALQATV